jgi:hypothetical protein
MAAAADRLLGDALETVSPELVLVDAALSAELRQRLQAPDDTLARIGRTRIESHPSVHPADVAVEQEVKVAEGAPAQPEPLPVQVGIDDLLVIPTADANSAEPEEAATIEDAYAETSSPRLQETDLAGAHHPAGVDDLIVAAADEPAETKRASRTYPPLPHPPDDADDEDATDVVLRQIRDHFEPEAPARRRRRRRLVSFVSLFAALCSTAVFAVDLQLGLLELPRWFPS